MGRTTGLLLGAGLALPVTQFVAAAVVWLWWRRDVRRAH